MGQRFTGGLETVTGFVVTHPATNKIQQIINNSFFFIFFLLSNQA